MIKKNDFVEIEFTGKILDTGEIFDTNIKEEAEKINPKIESVLHKSTIFQILKRLLDFILSVHDKRAISGNGLF